MSDDEGESTKRSSIMDNYLYGGDAAKAAAEAAAEATNTTADEASNIRRRSKSCEPSKLLQPGQTRIRNTEIERGVRIKHAKSMHSLAADQNERVQNDKNKLTELNDRLSELVDAIKSKKLANDNLEIEIKKYKEEILNSSNNSLRKQYTQDLDDAKKELNDVSQQSSLSKIRATRSLYELETLRDKFDMEIKLQEKAREKLSYLEQQRAETVHEIGFLKESCDNREKSNVEDVDKNERLRQQLMDLNMRLDGELELRVDLECKMQTMLEQKKFEEDIANLMRDELEKLFLYHGENKLFDDPSHFYNTELNQIKERIREDFRKMNEYSSQSLRDEYEFRYSKTVEEIEIQNRKAEEERIAKENEEMHNINNLKQEHLENEEELKNLRLNGFRLSQTLEELRNRLSDQSASYQNEAEMRDAEIAELIEQINNLKIEMSTMLSFSKTLDSEVSVYARLLNERFTQFMSSTDHLVTEEYNESSETKFSYDKYKESIFGNAQDEENENRRKREQEELRKKQRELEQREERLRELEMERERERERERLRKLQEQEMEEQRRRQREEEQRKQLELEEKERVRRQKELEEQNRLRELERRQYELEQETKRIWELEQQRLREVEEQERLRAEEERVRLEEEQEERLRQAAYEMEQRRLKEEDERRRIMEEKRREEYELQQRYEEIEQQRLRQLEDELAIQRMEEEHLRTKKQREEEEYLREQQRIEEIEERKMREREAELRRLEDIIVEEQQRKISQQEENTRRQQEEEQLRQRRIREIEAEKKRQQEMELQRVLREQEEEIRQKRLEEKRVKEEQQRQWELEQQRMREIEETTIIQQRRQLEVEQARRAKEQEQERQRRLEQEREEREKYILEKLKQEQELLELQKRQKLIVEQREREEYELEYRQRQQQDAQAPYVHSQHREVIGIDNISTITKRITEEKHKSTEVFEEEHIERLPMQQTETIEKQINIQLPDHPSYHNHHHHHHSSHNVISESSSSCSRNRQDSRHESSVVDHCVSSNNGHKHVLIVNSFKPKHTNSNSHISPVVSNVHTISNSNSRSQSPPKMRSSCDALCSTASNQVASTTNKTDNMSPKYAIKHKANRYVSGAIGILETSLNGEYIILENLSSNKNVNLKGWYIHRYVPDQNINLIFKFVNDTMLCCGEKLKILSRSCSTKIRSTSMYESANAVSHESSSSSVSFKPKDKYVSDGSEKIIIATNIENWGTYSKFSVTKLINPDGVDKAVLTQSLLRLASSTSNVNVSSPRESSPNMSFTHSNKQQQHQTNNNSSYYYNRAVSNSNLNRIAQTPNYYEQYSPRTDTVSTSTKKTSRTTEQSNSMSHLTTMSSAPYVVDGNNVHVTRQF